jgi:RNA polymerase sigma factor (sigma-70 family)
MTPLLAHRSRPDRAFERIYRRHVGDVYRYALAVMRNPVDAEDVTQTTFLNAYRAYVEKESRPDKPQNWLIAIAHNVCRQRFRQTSRRPTEVAFDEDVADAVLDDETPTAEDIRRALGRLAFNQRAALVMRELQGRSYAEIADTLGISTGAVETLIFRARRALREQMEGSLTCSDAELAISRQLDGRLSRQEKGQLRAHLRECPECAHFARRQRAQRSALKSLGLIPLPGSLTSLFGGGGGTAVGTGLALKAGAAVVAGVVIGGGGYEGARQVHWPGAQATLPKAAQPAGGATPTAGSPLAAPRRPAERGEELKLAKGALPGLADMRSEKARGHGRTGTGGTAETVTATASATAYLPPGLAAPVSAPAGTGEDASLDPPRPVELQPLARVGLDPPEDVEPEDAVAPRPEDQTRPGRGQLDRAEPHGRPAEPPLSASTPSRPEDTSEPDRDLQEKPPPDTDTTDDKKAK